MQTNLTELSSTFPEPLEFEIPRDSMSRRIAKSFGKTERLILEGSHGSGKTVQLSQFTREYSSQAFSYFISDNLWTWQQGYFLTSLCIQMNSALGKGRLDLTGNLVDVARLKGLFTNLAQSIVLKAKRENTRYYYVIDGLEWSVQGREGERIIDLLPLLTNPRGLFFLASCRSDSVDIIKFSCDRLPMDGWDRNNTIAFFKNTNLSENEIEELQRASDGMPGYLAAVKALILQDIPVAKTLDAKLGIQSILEMQWAAANVVVDSPRELLLALLVFSTVPLSKDELAAISGIPAITIEKELHLSALAHQNKTTGGYFFKSEQLKKLALDKLARLRDLAVSKLISFYESKDEPGGTDLLAYYYHEAKNYSGFKALVSTDNLVERLHRRRDLSVLKYDLRQATEMAEESQDWGRLAAFAFGSAAINSISEQLVGEDEVHALIALRRFGEAKSLALSASLPEVRIRLMAKIYSHMREEGNTISQELLDELQESANDLLQSNVKNKVLAVAADLYALLPDFAGTLINAIFAHTKDQSALDAAITYLSFQSQREPDREMISRISDPKLREMTMTVSLSRRKQNASSIIEHSQQIKSTEGKIFLLRNWCIDNKKSPEAHIVIDAALAIVNDDKDYSPPLRHLRQLSEPLKFCAPEFILDLAERFDIPNFTSLRSPIEERVRLELNIIEAVARISFDKAAKRFYEIIFDVMYDEMDVDTRCFCLTRVLITLSSIDSKNQLNSLDEVEQRLKYEYDALRMTSADQFELAKRTLRALTLVRPELALTFANQLNTQSRRDEGIREVLTSYVRQDRLSIDGDMLQKGLISIVNRREKHKAILEIISEVRANKRLLLDPSLRFLIQESLGVSDPDIKVQCLAEIIGALTDSKDENLRKDLYQSLLNTWLQINVLWLRTELGFEIVESLAEADKELATDFYEHVRKIRDTSSLANPIFGELYVAALRLASRTLRKIGSDSWQGEFVRLERLVDVIPSASVRVRVWAQIALELYYGGDKASFDNLMREKVLAKLNNLDQSVITEDVLEIVAPALFEYDASETIELLKRLPRDLESGAWARIAFFLLLQPNIDDPINADAYQVRIDNRCANRVLEAISHIETDGSLFQVIEAFSMAVAECPDTTLPEQQKLEILRKLDVIVNSKLPDVQFNIAHQGYRIAALSKIERARHQSVKRARQRFTPQWNALYQEAKSIPNIADRVLVMTWVAHDAHASDRNLSKKILLEVMGLLPTIPNVTDRIARLEGIAQAWETINETTQVHAALELARQLVASYQGADRDDIAASLIQVAHKLGPDFASELTTKIDEPFQQRRVSATLQIRELVRNPLKLLNLSPEKVNDRETLGDAASDIHRAMVSGKGNTFDVKVIGKWLNRASALDVNSGFRVAAWAIDSYARSNFPGGKLTQLELLRAMLASSELIYRLGNEISFLSGIPESIKQGFPSLAINTKIFRVGERDDVIEWVSVWIRENAKDYIKICDPYFSWKDLFILKSVPMNIKVTLVTTWKNMVGIKPGSVEVKDYFRQARKDDVSVHAPPQTLIFVVGNNDQDEFHDRYIVTSGAGLGIGASVNGWGNEDFVITILTASDAENIEKNYIQPRVDISARFAQGEQVPFQVFTLDN